MKLITNTAYATLGKECVCEKRKLSGEVWEALGYLRHPDKRMNPDGKNISMFVENA